MSRRYELPKQFQTQQIPQQIPQQMTQNNLQPPNNLSSPSSSTSFQFPSYLRFSSSIFPSSSECDEKSHVPQNLTICPGLVDKQTIPFTDFSHSTCPRCNEASCKGFPSPTCKVSSNGQSWKCSLCHHEIPFPRNTPDVSTIFSSPVYEVSLPLSQNRYPSLPCYVFVIDTSLSAISDGFTLQFITSIEALIPSLPKNISVLLVTYSNTISVYDSYHEYVFPDVREFEAVPLSFQPLEVSMSSVLSIISHIISKINEISNNLKTNQISNPQSIQNGSCLPAVMALLIQIFSPAQISSSSSVKSKSTFSFQQKSKTNSNQSGNTQFKPSVIFANLGGLPTSGVVPTRYLFSYQNLSMNEKEKPAVDKGGDYIKK